MKYLLTLVVSLSLLLMVSCSTIKEPKSNGENNSSVSSKQATTISANDVIGTFTWDTRSDLNELTYTITYQMITINEDATYEYKYEWVSKTMGQKVNSTETGTWKIEGKTLICTNDNKFTTVYEVNGKQLINTSKQGVVTTYKKD